VATITREGALDLYDIADRKRVARPASTHKTHRRSEFTGPGGSDQLSIERFPYPRSRG
jgi:hypothetical protein